MTKQELIKQVTDSKEFLDRSTGVLTEEDSALTPVDGMMTAAQQLAHIAQTIDWFVGQVMQATQGKANPKMVNDLLKEKLSG